MAESTEKPVKKCFIACVELELPVWAATAEEACRIARKNVRDDVSNLMAMDFYARPAHHYPDGWHDADDCLIYSDDDEITLKDALAATPEYQRAKSLCNPPKEGACD